MLSVLLAVIGSDDRDRGSVVRAAGFCEVCQSDAWTTTWQNFDPVSF
jgi:hypothetical protein